MAQTLLPLSSSLSLPFLILILSPHLSLSTSQPSQYCKASNNQPIKAGFYLSNSNHYSPISSLNPSLYTHIYYISTSNNDDSSSLSTFSQTLKSKNPSLKTLLSIDCSDASVSVQNNFINSTMEIMHANGFDGLDLTWQFPNSPFEMINFALLVQKLRARINYDPIPLILTASVYFSNHIFDIATTDIYYPTNIMSNNLDWINIFSFGFYKSTNVTVFDAQLYDKSSHYSVSYGIISWIDAGIPACKLVIGIPLYGKSYILKNKYKNGLGAPIVAYGPKQKASNRTGIIAYFELEELLMDQNAVFLYDNNTVSTYFHLGDLWVSFDSIDVIKAKIEFALRYNLKGYFLWPVNYEDSNYTISNLASEIWNKNLNVSYSRNSGGNRNNRFKQAAAAAPFELPPLENAPAQYSISESSDLIRWSLEAFSSHLILFYICFISSVLVI